MRTIQLALAMSALMLITLSGPSSAQNIRLGPGGVEINPPPEAAPPPVRRPPPARPLVRDELRDRMLQFREACEDGDRRSCVRLGVIIGENRERRAAWRRDHPELFFYER